MFCDHFKKKKKEEWNQPTPKQLLINLNTNYSTLEQSDELFKNDFWEKEHQAENPKVNT